MIELNRSTLILLAAGLGLLGVSVVVFIASKGGLAGAGKSLGAAAVAAADGVASGVVIGIGEEIGIPQTNMTKCERALAEGRKWDASFDCPAGTFLKHVFD